MRKPLEPDPAPANWTGTNEAQEWDDKVAAARDAEPTELRDTATKWAASIAGLLGILSTVAFVAGRKALATEVGGTEADIAAWLILAAAAMAAVAVLLATLAGQGSPQWTPDLTGWKFLSLTRKRNALAAAQIRASRYLVVAALLMIVLATGIAWMAALTGEPVPDDQSAIVVTPAGLVRERSSRSMALLRSKSRKRRVRLAKPLKSRSWMVVPSRCPLGAATT